MNIISYSLFSMVKSFNHIRSWDNHKHLNNRYWVNIPSLILINNILYPNYKTKFYISKSIENNELYSLLLSLQQNQKFNFLLEKWDLPFSGREPSVWRMCPVWDKSNNIVLTRDIDSLPNISEYKCCRYFEQTSCSIMSIRSHCGGHSPSGSAVRMLAGLSGFKPHLINFLPEKFDEYYHNSKNFGDWGLDQGVMIHYFLEKNNEEYLKNNFMDCAINCQTQNSVWPCFPVNENILNTKEINISLLQQQILDLISPLTDWAGKPIDSRCLLKQLLTMSGELGIELRKILQSNHAVKTFYNV